MKPSGGSLSWFPGFLVKLSVFAVLCASLNLVFAGRLRADEFTQVSHYSARMFSFETLTIDTRVGNVRIKGWDEPRVEVEAEKLVRAGSQEKAEKLYDRLQVDLEGEDRGVLLRTIYPPRRPWRPFRGESKLTVNYRIKMPYDANLHLKCVDGDVQISGLRGDQYIRVNYGDVEIDLPSVYRVRSVKARSWLGYVQSNLHGEDNAGFGPKVLYWDPSGEQDIDVRVRMGGIFIYKNQ